MKRTLLSTALVGSLALVLVGAAVQEKQSTAPKKDVVFASSADDAKYKEVMPGVSRLVLWGDPDKGPYGAFTKFTPGQNHALHSHTSDLRIVGIKGAYIYKPDGGDEKRVGPGQFLLIPGGAHHVSTSDAKDGAIFYEEGVGKFDLLPVDAKK